jgi:hypothetical protein
MPLIDDVAFGNRVLTGLWMCPIIEKPGSWLELVVKASHNPADWCTDMANEVC